MFDLTEFCRICTRAECKLIDIFSEDNDSIKFSDKLAYCVADAIYPDDILPNLICDSCCDNLKISFSFKKVCLKTRLALSEYIRSTKKQKGKNEIFEQNEKVQIKSEPISDDEYDDSYETLEELRVEDVFSDIIGVPRKPDPVNVTIKTEPMDYDPENDENMSTICKSCNEKISTDEVNVTNDQDVCDKCSVGNKLYSCTQCDEKFEDKDSLNEHEKSHCETIPSFVCSVCNYSYTRDSHLQAHMRIHTGEKPYTCNMCNESFAWNHHLQRHMKVHYKENCSFCTICQKPFGSIEELENHIKTHTNQTSPANSVVKSVIEHNINAEIERLCASNAFKQGSGCPECGKKFNKRSNMLKHLWFHNGERTGRSSGIISCEICKKKFKGKHKLQIHMRVHTGERPFSCKICHKNFTQSGYLSYHMRIHTGEKPFQCKECGKCFTQKTTLSTHMRVHADKIPISCPICNKHVSYNSTLRRHIKLMHSWVLQQNTKVCE